MKVSLIGLVVAATASGCGLLPQHKAELSPSRETVGLGEVITLPAQLRLITIKKDKASFSSCAEPMPDIALSNSFKLISGINARSTTSTTDGATDSSAGRAQELGLNNDLQVTTSALELAGRTQIVLLAREFMFRTCESAANGWLDPKEIPGLHQRVIDNITSLVTSESIRAYTAQTKAATAAAAAGVELDMATLRLGASIVSDVNENACADTRTQCLSKPGVDEKGKLSCKTEFSNCIKRGESK